MNRIAMLGVTLGTVLLAAAILFVDNSTSALFYNTCGVTTSNFIFHELKRLLFIFFGTC